MIQTHTCTPGEWCAVCDHNERHGGARNHPHAPRRPTAHAASPARVSLPVVPCVHVGDDLTGPERQARGLDHARRWTRCEHPAQPLGEVVCGCRGCGPTCRGYQAETPDAADLPRWHPVPPPVITPTRDRLVVTVVVGDDAEQLHALTGPGQRGYAERHGADYLVIRGETQDRRMACAEKWRVKDYVPHYPGGTLYADADVVVRPTAPAVWDVAPPTSIGMRETTTFPNKLAWAAPKLRAVCRSQGVDPHPVALSRYWNSGVWVGRPEHAGYWQPPEHPYPAEFTAEEHWCRQTLAVRGWPVHDLGEDWNWLYYADRQMRRTHGRHFLHVSGSAGDKAKRLAVVRRLAGGS
jgi:hypothetical protein